MRLKKAGRDSGFFVLFYLCSATYLTPFYIFRILFKFITAIFDSNLKRNFKYGKHATKYGKSG